MRTHLPAAPGIGFVAGLASHGDAEALVTETERLTYRELAERVHEAGLQLGGQAQLGVRRLVLLAATNQVDSVVQYLGALWAGHPVLLAPGDNPAALESLVGAYDPDVVVTAAGVDHRRPGSAHELHPELALLLSTSGSTGSPKLVRLSHQGVHANAEAIAGYLGIRGDDRAATSLPPSYCYGLSVINSYLARGAALLVTDASVTDQRFWSLFRQERGTTLAGVPHSFELLERIGFADMDLPHLRYVTQAGGRMAPGRVRQLARLGRSRGWDLVVMYGQAEATARMAYLPPDLAEANPASVGVPIPGGSLRLRSVEDAPTPDVGELVYRGPNVMLGYARSPDDLALGRVEHELATGDLARRTPAGLFEIVGRRTRFAKVCGLRVDLDRAEDLLGSPRRTVCCAEDDASLVVAVEGSCDVLAMRRRASSELGVPVGAVRVVAVPAVPRLPNGKVDHRAVAALTAARPADTQRAARAGRGVPTIATLRALYGELLAVPHVRDDDSFVSLGGDSLSYVEMSIRLEDLLGTLPREWHRLPLQQLAGASDACATADSRPGDGLDRPLKRKSGRRWRGHALETSVALRAVAILLVVATHAQLVDVKGSAHVLVAIAGYNFARFQLTDSPRRERLWRQLRSVVRIALPAMAWIGAIALATGRYGVENVLLLNVVLGPERWSPEWDFWFVEVLVLTLVAMAAAFSMPWLDRVQRRHPFSLAGAVLGLGLGWRFNPDTLDLLHTKPVLWLFALGWAAAAARSSWQRAVVTGAAALAVPGFFDDPARDTLILAGIVALIWLPTLACPAWLGRAAGVLASASLFVYLTHWAVYPVVAPLSPLLAVLASLTAGVAYGKAAVWTMRRLPTLRDQASIRRDHATATASARPEPRR